MKEIITFYDVAQLLVVQFAIFFSDSVRLELQSWVSRVFIVMWYNVVHDRVFDDTLEDMFKAVVRIVCITLKVSHEHCGVAW